MTFERALGEVYIFLSTIIFFFLLFTLRYIFKSKDKAELQELGPRFTLKLKWLQKGTFDKDGDYEWMFKVYKNYNKFDV